MKKNIVILCMSFFVNSVFSACPQLFNADVPPGSTSSAGYTAKRINRNNTTLNTIFFCKEPRPASHTTINFSKNDFIGNAAGVDKISLNDFSENSPIGTSSVTISNANPIADYPLNEQAINVLANQPQTWGERTIWHFYKRIAGGQSCNWNRHRSIRTYLRNNPDVFDLGVSNTPPTIDTSQDWSIAKKTDVLLTNSNGKQIKADIDFYWLQNKDRGGGQNTGGSWRRTSGPWWNREDYRYCHFAVAVEFKLKTNFHGSTYNIDESGEYKVTTGVMIKN